MGALRQGPNLRKFLCKSKLSSVSRSSKFQRKTHFNSNGWKKCSKPCPICPFATAPQVAVKSPFNDYELM